MTAPALDSGATAPRQTAEPPRTATISKPGGASPAPPPVPVVEAQVREPVMAAPQPIARSAPAVTAVTKSVPAPRVASAAPKPQASTTVATQPQGKETVVADRKSRTFLVTADMKTAAHPYFGKGKELGFVVDGVPGKELALTRGVTYTFEVDTGIQHDFYFTTSAVGWGGGTVTDGVKGQFIYRGVATFTPSDKTPDTVFYQCRNHKFMGGKLHIAHVGDKVTLGGGAVVGDEQTVAVDISPQKVKQKLGFADMVIGGSSASAKRIAASGNVEAQGMVAEAKQHLSVARGALSAGDHAKAMGAVDEALRLMNTATRLVPDESSVVDEKVRYAELREQASSFEASYSANESRGMKPKAGQELNRDTYDRLLKDAESLAANGDYASANGKLDDANQLISAALSAMLHGQEMVYDKNFATPKEQYEYELSRYKSYEELVPVAIEERKPAPQTVKLMDELVVRSTEIQDEALALAAQGDYKMAIMALEAATARVQRALRLAGVQ